MGPLTLVPRKKNVRLRNCTPPPHNIIHLHKKFPSFSRKTSAPKKNCLSPTKFHLSKTLLRKRTLPLPTKKFPKNPPPQTSGRSKSPELPKKKYLPKKNHI